MYKTEVEFSKVFNNVFYPEIEKGTELNEEDYNNLYIINQEQKNENKYYLSIVNNTLDNNSEKLQESFIDPEDNNKLSQKQPKDQLNEKNSNLFISKKTAKSITDQIKFTTIEHEETHSTKKRKKHDKYSSDNIITKVKSFIFRILILFLNQFLENIFKEKKDCLRQICCKQAINGTVDFNQKLIKSQLKFILSDTGDDYNKSILNDLSKYQIIKTFLELKLEDIFNYLRNKINDEEKIGANKIFKIIKIPKKNLDLYTLYQRELSIRIIEDQKIIEDDIKADFVKIINNRKSVNIKRIKKILKKKNK